MGFFGSPRKLLQMLALFSSFTAFVPLELHAQETAPKPAEKPAEKKTEDTATPKKAENPAQIELLETRYRFKADGSSRKEVHARVQINSELGVRQFARLNFDYNRSFESVEIPLVRITHPSGGIADILPSAITDNPNPAVVNAPAYQDVRVQSVRILGLQPGDLLEYRVISVTSHHPLAPDFWLDHSFDRTGIVSQEVFELDLPESRSVHIRINPKTPATSIEKSGEGDTARSIYRWQHAGPGTDKQEKKTIGEKSDVALTTFSSWDALSVRLADSLQPKKSQSGDWVVSSEISRKAKALTENGKSPVEKIEAIYDFVSEKLSTIDLPLGATGFATHSPSEVLTSKYATAEDKFVLFAALSKALGLEAFAELAGAAEDIRNEPPQLSLFSHLLITIAVADNNSVYWLDPSLDVTPFNMVSSVYRGTWAFFVAPELPTSDDFSEPWSIVPETLPFAASQKVSVDASIAADGKLIAKVHYSLRGDNELLLRVAFHQAPNEKWKDLAQLLSLSDGFRGKVSTVTVSDPYATREPFTVDYEITMPKFVDWSKKPVHIPALLPQIGLPDPPTKPATGAASSPIDLGTPLEVETRMTLHLPSGTTVLTPTGTSVQRDYATFASQYSAKEQTITASRHINFLLREVPAERAADYNAFLRAVQNDEAQDFTLDRVDSPNQSKQPSAPKSPAPSQPAQPKP